MPIKDPEARRAYQRARNKTHPEMARARTKAWYARNAEQERIKARARYKEDPEKHRARSADWRAANPGKVQAQRKRYYSANREVELAKTKARQDRTHLAGRPRPDFCDACGRPPGRLALAFDHSHVKGHFRGWLCAQCNTALGLVNDDALILRKLIAYLERNRENTAPQLALAGI